MDFSKVPQVKGLDLDCVLLSQDVELDHKNMKNPRPSS